MARTASVPAAPGRGLRSSPALLRLRSDESLVARVRAGDEVAFEVLYERHVPGVLAFCRHMLGSRDEGEDAVQQAFVSAHNSLTGGDERDINFKPWIYTIARNRCLSMRRVQKPPAVELEDPPSTVGLADEVATRADLRALLADLGELADDQRAALVLTELEDLSHAEVAAVLGCEAKTVKGIVFRARAALSERRDARDAECEEIRAQLAVARGGSLRRGLLKHHLKECDGCTAYLEDLRRQRRMLALVLPVTPSLGLKEQVLGAAGIAGTGGGLIAVGGMGATLAKVATAGVLIGGAGVAGEAAFDARQADEPPAAATAAPSADTAADFRALPIVAASREAARQLAKAPADPGRGRERGGRGASGDARGPGSAGQGNRGSGNAGGNGNGRGNGQPNQRQRGRPAGPGRSNLAPGRAGSAPGQAQTPPKGPPATPPGKVLKPVTPDRAVPPVAKPVKPDFEE